MVVSADSGSRAMRAARISLCSLLAQGSFSRTRPLMRPMRIKMGDDISDQRVSTMGPSTEFPVASAIVT